MKFFTISAYFIFLHMYELIIMNVIKNDLIHKAVITNICTVSFNNGTVSSIMENVDHSKVLWENEKIINFLIFSANHCRTT